MDPEKCTNCGTCEYVCSLKHFSECNPTRSFIRPLRYEKMGSHFYSIPVVCQQCGTPMCKEVCPVNAISQDSKTGAYVVNKETCVGCKLCVIACPLGGIQIDLEKNIAAKCDLCDGDPQCAKFCLPGAITSVRKDQATFTKRRLKTEKLSKALTRTGAFTI